MPEESRLVGYADDVAALVAGRTVEQAQSRLGILMRRVSGWMTAHGFNLALEKTEVADALDKEVHRKRLAQVQRRGALRVASAYRTVFELAVMVSAGAQSYLSP